MSVHSWEIIYLRWLYGLLAITNFSKLDITWKIHYFPPLFQIIRLRGKENPSFLLVLCSRFLDLTENHKTRTAR